MKNSDELINNYITELRRGTLTCAVLISLEEATYGYALLEVLNGNDIIIEGNTLYPLLRRLDKQGLLESLWDTSDSRPRKFYKINDTGRKVRDALIEEIEIMKNSLERLRGIV